MQLVRAVVLGTCLVHMLPALLLNLVQLGARLAEIFFVDCVLERAARAVELGVHLKLVFLLVKFGEARLDEFNRLLNLVSAALGILHDLERLPALVLVHARTTDLLQQVQTLLVLHGGHLHDLTLLDAVVRVGARKSRRLEKVDDFCLGDVLLVEIVLVLLETDVTSQTHLLPVHGQAVVGVVEDDLGVRGHHRMAGALVQELLTLVRPQRGEDVREDEPDGVEKVGLAGSIRTDCGGGGRWAMVPR